MELANSLNVTVKETMSSLEIAEVTGKQHRNILRDIDELLKQGVDVLNFEQITYKDGQNRQQRCYKLTGKGVLILASGYNPLLREKIINRWEELETANKQTQEIASQTMSTLQEKLQAATWAADFLHLSDASKLMMVKSVLDPLGLPTPDYVESKGAHLSAHELLKKHNAGISPKKFNEILIRLGYLTEMERDASNGKRKKFKLITNKGEEYGENMVSPYNKTKHNLIGT